MLDTRAFARPNLLSQHAFPLAVRQSFVESQALFLQCELVEADIFDGAQLAALARLHAQTCHHGQGKGPDESQHKEKLDESVNRPWGHLAEGERFFCCVERGKIGRVRLVREDFVLEDRRVRVDLGGHDAVAEGAGMHRQHH